MKEDPKDTKTELEPAPKLVKRVTAGNFKKAGRVYGPGEEVMVSADDILANPGNFSKVAEPVKIEPTKGDKK